MKDLLKFLTKLTKITKTEIKHFSKACNKVTQIKMKTENVKSVL